MCTSLAKWHNDIKIAMQHKQSFILTCINDTKPGAGRTKPGMMRWKRDFL